MYKFLIATILLSGWTANAFSGADHSGGDPVPDSCLESVVTMGQYGAPESAKLLVDFASNGTADSKFTRDCLLADSIYTTEDKKFFALHSATNGNAIGLGLEEAQIIYRFVCTKKVNFDDFYLVKSANGNWSARYSQFLLSCPLKIK